MSFVMPGQKIDAFAWPMCPGGRHAGRIGMKVLGRVG